MDLRSRVQKKKIRRYTEWDR